MGRFLTLMGRFPDFVLSRGFAKGLGRQSGCRKRRSAKGLRSLFFFRFGTLFVTFWSLFLMLLSLFSSLFCRTPFAGLLLRQGEKGVSLICSDMFWKQIGTDQKKTEQIGTIRAFPANSPSDEKAHQGVYYHGVGQWRPQTQELASTVLKPGLPQWSRFLEKLCRSGIHLLTSPKMVTKLSKIATRLLKPMAILLKLVTKFLK